MPTLRIAVLYGGDSAEREVSLESGSNVAAALSSRGHAVTLIDPRAQPVASVEWSNFDGTFIALHGTYGEDGTVQAELDALGVIYTGSSAAASRLAFDKSLARNCFLANDLPVAEARLIRTEDSLQHMTDAAKEIGLPLVVKPCCQGSSVGVSIVREYDRPLVDALQVCFAHDSAGLIERLIPGDEWTVGILDQHCFTPIRITTPRVFYDYDAKYEDDATQYHPADDSTSPELIARLNDVSRRACDALGVTGIARVDLRLDEQGSPVLLEVNTVPGFTTHSLVPKAAQAEGLSLGELCEKSLLSRL